MRRFILLMILLICMPLAAEGLLRDKTGRYPGHVSYVDSLQAMPESDVKYDLLAEYYEQQAEFNRCDSLLDAGLALFPDSRLLLLHKANVLQRESRYDEAGAIYRSLGDDDTDSSFLMAWAQNEMLAGRLNAADSLFSAAYALSPQEAFDLRYRFLYAYVSAQQAERLLLRHVYSGQGTPEQWILAGDVWIERNKPYRALHAYEAAGVDSNFVAALMTVRLREYLRPELYGRFELITEDLEASSSTYRRSYMRLSHRFTDALTATAEWMNANVVRIYEDYDEREERNVSAATGSVYLLPVSSLYMGGSWQYYLNHKRSGDWTATMEQQLDWSNVSFWWKVEFADHVIEYGEFKRQSEYTMAIQADKNDVTLQAGYSYYHTPQDEIYVTPEFPWMYNDIAVKANHGYHATLSLDYAVIDELSLGAYAVGRGYKHESRFYSSPARQIDYGLQATLTTTLNGMDIDLNAQAGMDDDNRSNWGSSLDASFDTGHFRYSIGLNLNKDEYSSSRILSFSISELAL